MFDTIYENPRKSMAVLLAPMFVSIVYLLLVVIYSLEQNDGYLGALLDDTWIHIRYAESISDGRGLMYNEGVVTSGATSPLWVLLLGAIYTVTDPNLDQQLHTAIVLSVIGHLLMILAISGFGWWATRQAWVGILAGIMTALTGRLIWMGLSGMEMTFFTFLCILSLWYHIADIRTERIFSWRTGIMSAIATLARPEGYLLTALIAFDAFIIIPLILKGKFRFWSLVRASWRGVFSYLLLAGSYPVVTFLLTGYPLPNTFRAKSQLGHEWPELPRTFFWTPEVDHGFMFIVFAGIGIIYLLWRNRQDYIGIAWAVWPVVFVLSVLFLGPQNFVVNNGRYVSPAIPFHALAASIGIWATTNALTRWINAKNTRVQIKSLPRSSQHLPAMIALILAIILVSMTFISGLNPTNQTHNQAWRVAQDTAQLRRMHVEAGYWFIENTQPGDLIALNDVGAMIHISDRPVLDMVGLVSPEVLDVIQSTERGTCLHDLQLARLMLDKPPVLIAVFPWWYPCLTAWPGVLQPYTLFTITGSTVIGGGELVIYWPIWENWPIQRMISSEARTLMAGFEQGIGLKGFQIETPEEGLQVSLWWGVEAQPDNDYTVFVHLIDPKGKILSQHDSRPQGGHFNTTWWRPGDIIRDTHLIPLDEPGLLENDDLSLRVGLYPTSGGQNLLRTDGISSEQAFVIIPLGKRS